MNIINIEYGKDLNNFVRLVQSFRVNVFAITYVETNLKKTV